MKKIFVIILVFFLLWSGYQTRQHPQLKFNSLTDRITHPLDTRLRYRIAEVDPRFKLSVEQVKAISQQATQVWKDGTGKDYFVYDPNAQLTIHLIYDERQYESEQRREHLSRLETNQQQWLNKKKQLDQIEQEVLQNKQILDQKQLQLDQQIQYYNRSDSLPNAVPPLLSMLNTSSSDNSIYSKMLSNYSRKLVNTTKKSVNSTSKLMN